MVINLPSELGEILNILGFDWPMSNEDQLFEMGQEWMNVASRIGDQLQQAATSAQEAWVQNTGESIEGFKQWWESDDSPAEALYKAVVGANLGGAALMVCAGIVLALKIVVIVQLVLLAIQIATALAAAAATFGIAGAALPAIYALGRKIIGDLIQEAIMRLAMG
ncbi:WXG100-like domain-containing protein [Glycomyces terrestris]|uniref:Outer membrane channel protein CpnT-like N-terminal domain-containing protein n=1 Tax=Glycomyces terrestris TaxID=2493553 RepID=A0A426V4F1_9ACTN|nr:hypothetical protein [Glycomyces terrestris]RRS01756.1 hypothetical protein EIW28_03080 [Glycomyces terrestris]